MPTLTLQPDETSSKDQLIDGDAGTVNTNFGNFATIQVGKSVSDGVTLVRSLLQFDLSSIPSDATINSATLTLTLNQAGSFDSSNNRTVRAYRLLRAWTELGVTWNKYDGTNNWGTAGAGNTSSDREATDIGTASLTTALSSGATVNLSLTASKVQEWVSGVLANNGFLLQSDTETNDRYLFDSSSSATAGNRPKLVIDYTTQGGSGFIYTST